MEKVSLEKFAGGALAEQFGKAFENVIENLLDPNTSFKEPRKITISMKFTQNELRDDVRCEVTVSEKLASQGSTSTSFAIGTDLKTKKVYANEYGKNQYQFDVIPVDKESGEVIEEKDSIQSIRLIDYRNVK